MGNFEFTLTEQEKDYLRNLAWESISSRLGMREEQEFTPPVSDRMEEKLGAFVTLKKNGRLRGCIGNVVGDIPLWKTIIKMAESAAFEDPRFPPINKDEFTQLEIEISILSPFERVEDIQAIEPGRDGLLVRKSWHSGLLLPQVATEWGWDRETFLAQTCQKAGLRGDCWKDTQTEIFWFQAEVF